MVQLPPHNAEQVFNSDDISTSQRDGTIVKVPSCRSYRVYKKLLNSVDADNSTGLPTPPSSVSSSATTSPTAESSFVIIPEYMISYETLLYVGFDAKTANLIWTRWSNMTPDQGREIDGGPITFDSMWSAHIYGRSESHETDDRWKSTMDACGIDSELQEAILDPGFERLRQTQSCRFWMLDSTRARYRGLEEIRAASTKRAGLSLSGTTCSQKTLAAATCTSREAREKPAGCTVLFKGGYFFAMQRIFAKSSSSPELSHIFQHHAGDFSQPRNGPRLYLTDDVETACHQAAYAKRRAISAGAVVLRIEVPTSSLDSLGQLDKRITLAWPSKDCKELVWYSGRQERLPDKMKHYTDATLIIGPSFSIGPAKMLALPSPENITDAVLVYNSRGGKVEQYCFKAKGADHLEKSMKPNCRLFGVNEEEMVQCKR